MSHPVEILKKGFYRARLAEGGRDLAAALALRGLCFGRAEPDHDPFDGICAHVLVEDLRSGQLVCCFRVLELENGSAIKQSYSAQYYELAALVHFRRPMAEIGRFCMHPDWSDPDILRLAWATLTRMVDDRGVEMLFGCSSFAGTNVDQYLDAFAMLNRQHLGPDRWRPRVKASHVVRFAALLHHHPDVKQAMLQMPPLLRSYLMMGGWVSDHAVVDDGMNTLHVFTGLEIRAIPASRKRLLRAVAAEF